MISRGLLLFFSAALHVACYGSVFTERFIILQAAAEEPNQFSFRDIYGNLNVLRDESELVKASVFYFYSVDCPVSNKYIPILNELFTENSKKNISFYAVNSVAAETRDEVAEHAREYRILFPVVKDWEQRIAKRFKAKTTSEVVVIDSNAHLLYQGRVSDRFSFGIAKPKALHHELRDVLTAINSGANLKVASKPATGCVLKYEEPLTPSSAAYQPAISKIVESHCQRCHRSGGIAPFPLEKVEHVRAWSPMIDQVLREHQMPPWYADRRHGSFSNSLAISDENRQALLSWVRGPMKTGEQQGSDSEKGEEAELKIKNDSNWSIGKPDLIYAMPKEEPIPPITNPGGYIRNFYVETGLDKDVFVSEIEILPRAVEVVHHVVVYIIKSGKKGFSGRERGKWGYFAAYGPGIGPVRFPKGYAKRLPAKATIVLNLHYTPIGKVLSDLTQVGLRLSREKTPREVETDSVRVMEFNIPPEERYFTFNPTKRLNNSIHLLSVLPHGHYRARSFSFSAQRPGQKSETLLSIPLFDFRWQYSYEFSKPVILPKGTVLGCSAHYDNSSLNPLNPDSSKTVSFGERSSDEMMFCYYDFVVADNN